MGAEDMGLVVARQTAGLHECEVVGNGPDAKGIFLLRMRAEGLSRALAPGQFVNVAVPGDATQILRVPLSCSGILPDEGLVEISYAVVGDGTRRLSEVPVGTSLGVVGPCGHGWGPIEGKALLVAGGIGAAPIVCEARRLGVEGVPFDAALGAQSAARLWGEAALARAGAGEVLVATDDGSAGIAGFATLAAERLLAKGGYSCVLCCGPQPLMAAVAGLAGKAGVPCLVSLERMMSCGFGACCTCNVSLVGGRQASCCMDGPVFDASEVVW
jgi:dihydroorotate dehydrogenase electron transfer subunit